MQLFHTYKTPSEISCSASWLHMSKALINQWSLKRQPLFNTLLIVLFTSTDLKYKDSAESTTQAKAVNFVHWLKFCLEETLFLDSHACSLFQFVSLLKSLLREDDFCQFSFYLPKYCLQDACKSEYHDLKRCGEECVLKSQYV